MNIELSMTKDDVRTAIAEYIEKYTGIEPNEFKMIIETKSKQNYRSEWEEADFRIKFVVTK